MLSTLDPLLLVAAAAGVCLALVVATWMTVRARAAAYESEERFKKVFRLMPVPLSMSRVDGERTTWIDVNEAFAKLACMRREDLIGKSSVSAGLLYDEDERAANARAESEGLRAKPTTLHTRNGDKHVLFYGHPIDVDGTPHLLGITVDVTDLRRAEGAERQLQEEVRVAQKLESLGRLAGGVAHDFNNLLTVMTSALALLGEEDAEEEEQEQAIGDMRDAVTRAVSLTRQLLAFSRREVVVCQPVDVNGLVADTEKMLRRLVGEDIAVTTELSPERCVVNADPGQLVQVLMNLAVNSRDAIRERRRAGHGDAVAAAGGGRLTFKTKRSGGAVELVVEDDGCGMSPSVRARIFEPFFTTKPNGTGTGLGLSVIHGIVARAGGSVDVDSALGRGTAVRVRLPALVEGAASTGAAAASLPVAMTPPSSTISLPASILVVEDEDTVRSVTARILKSLGFDVVVARDGAEAMAVLRRRPVDVTLLDVVMPGLCGSALAEALRTIRPELRVIYVSGYSDDEVVHRGVTEQGAVLLQKPWSPDALVERIHAALAM